MSRQDERTDFHELSSEVMIGLIGFTNQVASHLQANFHLYPDERPSMALRAFEMGKQGA